MADSRYDNYRPIGRRPAPRSTDGFITPTTVRRPAPSRPQVNTAVAVHERPHNSVTPQTRSPLYKTIPNASNAAEDTPKREKGRVLKKPMTRRRKILLRGVVPVLAVLLGVGGLLGFKAIMNLDKVFHGNVISDATAAFDNTPLKGENTGRVNILLAGDSVDDLGHGGADLTDSILILSINTKTHSAFLISVPRDLWVNIPGLGTWQKINAANTVSKFNEAGYPAGGMGQLEQIVQTDFKIPIDYYGIMDYGAFKDAVNAVGGVTLNIASPNPKGLYDPYTNLKLPNGPVSLNGQQALNLARARGDGPGAYGFPNSDFDRTEHQRQAFVAVAGKAKSIGVLANPVKISDLINTLGNNFRTDLSLQNVLRLVQITKGVNMQNIQSYSFSSTLSGASTSNAILTAYTDPRTGEEALSPTAGIGNYSQMQAYYQQLTSNNPIAKESPNAVILNGSGTVGLAAKERTALESQGFNVTSVADASAEYPGTMIVNTAGSAKPNSLKALQKTFPGTTVTSATQSAEAKEAQNYTADFVVVLGQNWDSPTSSSTQ